MDYDERMIMREEARIEENVQFVCEGCGKTFCGIVAIDPIVIDGVPWCDCCASNLSHLRMSEEINGVAEKTKKLKS